jgi:hypothetical protein
MERFHLHILSVAMIAFFLGCATLSRNECLEADWFEIGRKDGMIGKPRALFQKTLMLAQNMVSVPTGMLTMQVVMRA